MQPGHGVMNIDAEAGSSEFQPEELLRHRSAMVVIDVVESVRLMQLDEAGVIRMWRRFVQHVKTDVLSCDRGRLVKSLGDGLLLEFHHVPDAVQAAMAMQGYFARTALQAGGRSPPLHIRAGVHVADVVRDELDLYGSGVNLAARLAALAAPGEIVVSAEVRDTLIDGLDADVEDLGECFLKHWSQPVRAFRLSPPVAVAGATGRGARPLADLRPTLAALPLEAGHADPMARGLADAMVDELIAGLSSARDLKVISRLSIMALQGRAVAMPAVAAQLGADYLISGRLMVHQGRMHVSLQLMDASASSVLWADTLRCEVADLFEPGQRLALDLAARIVNAIVMHEAMRATAQPLASLRSYSLMLGAITLMHRSTRHEFEKARSMLEHLIEREHGHARPHAWLANWHALRVTQLRPGDSTEDVERALYHARQALARDPGSSLALAIDGVLRMNLTKDFDIAQQRFDAALDSNPNEALAWLFKGVLHAFKGGHGEAEPAAERALSLSPLDPMRHYFDSLAATAALGDGLYELAEHRALRSLRANRQHPSTYRALAIAQSMQGKHEEAAGTVRGLLQLSPGYRLRDFRQMSGFGKGPLAGLFTDALAAAGLSDG